MSLYNMLFKTVFNENYWWMILSAFENWRRAWFRGSLCRSKLPKASGTLIDLCWQIWGRVVHKQLPIYNKHNLSKISLPSNILTLTNYWHLPIYWNCLLYVQNECTEIYHMLEPQQLYKPSKHYYNYNNYY